MLHLRTTVLQKKCVNWFSRFVIFSVMLFLPQFFQAVIGLVHRSAQFSNNTGI